MFLSEINYFYSSCSQNSFPPAEQSEAQSFGKDVRIVSCVHQKTLTDSGHKNCFFLKDRKEVLSAWFAHNRQRLIIAVYHVV